METRWTDRERARLRLAVLACCLGFWVCVGIAVFGVGGCSLKSIVSNEPPTAADCATIRAYIDMCNSELIKSSIPKQTRQWWDLAMAGAQIELARKCAGGTAP